MLKITSKSWVLKDTGDICFKLDPPFQIQITANAKNCLKAYKASNTPVWFHMVSVVPKRFDWVVCSPMARTACDYGFLILIIEWKYSKLHFKSTLQYSPHTNYLNVAPYFLP